MAMANGALSLDSLVAATNRPRAAITKAVQTLKRRGLALSRTGRRAETGGFERGRYALTDAGRSAAKSGVIIPCGKPLGRPGARVVGLRDRIWWHLRAHRVVTLSELLNTHADGTEKSAQTNIYKYLAALARVGVIRRQAKRLPARKSGGHTVWLFVRDLGPKTPVVRPLTREVYDPNSGQVLKMTEESDV